jgi:sugar/nucleoside kinase (ribokinase family)
MRVCKIKKCQVLHAVQVLEQLPQARGVLVSAGEKGSSYAFRSPGGKLDLCGVVPVMEVAVVDTTGAGDAYTAGGFFRLCTSNSLEQGIHCWVVVAANTRGAGSR